ncbi:hypothetical protein [Echinimonas agarilytica]|uniref:Uncharacterized protein n=1 Tax=Echinimonas agarilytica TaxID=1215918 RepID=A0AA41W8V8_9GAMM|nr:hypothetical protein [Echinimonas agarilytica]MCM2681462.1 hypothetical protein [Echinimonas agarilytica]
MSTNAFKLNEHFSIERCSFVSGEEAVLFSPQSLQTLLCHSKVVDVIIQWQHSGCFDKALSSLESDPELSQQIIDKLEHMQIIERIPQL